MLNKQEFLDYIENHILEYISCPENKEVLLRKVTKNNSVKLNGLCVGPQRSDLQPIVYLETYYQEYLTGKDLGELLVRIAAVLDDAQTHAPKEDLIYSDYKQIKDRIFYRVINLKQNQEELQSCPYDRFYDLAVTYRWYLYCEDGGMSSALVRNDDLKRWNVDAETIKEDANKNTQKLFPPVFKHLWEMIPEAANLPAEEKTNLYILTNKQMINGASAMLYDHILDEFASRFESDLFLLPSSVHEVILLPKDKGKVPTLMEISQTVRMINRTMVNQEDFLSDSVYLYERERGCLSIEKV